MKNLDLADVFQQHGANESAEIHVSMSINSKKAKKRLAQYVRYIVARHRRTLPVRMLVRCAQEVIQSYNNCSTNTGLNGEEFVIRALARLGAAEIFDVGANHGHWALCATKICPTARIHCFEPIPATFQLLTAETRAYSSILPVNQGMSNEPGQVEFQFNKDHDTLSSLCSSGVHALDFEVVKCSMTTGDQYMRDRKLCHIDFLKIDVEGAEMQVLNGFAHALQDKQITAIQFEYGMASIISRVLLYDYHKFFARHHYVVGAIYPNYVDFRDYSFRDENFLTPNFLAIREDNHDLRRLLNGTGS